jgi:hypothetical protein
MLRVTHVLLSPPFRDKCEKSRAWRASQPAGL